MVLIARNVHSPLYLPSSAPPGRTNLINCSTLSGLLLLYFPHSTVFPTPSVAILEHSQIWPAHFKAIHMDTSGNNSYPSPPSSPNSPNVPEEQVTAPNSSILHRATISAVSEASRETQRHLQQTSAALDAAYNRIRLVRRSLLQLSESLPAALSQLRLRVPEDQHALGHDADTFSLPPVSSPHSAEELGGGRGARERAPWNHVRSGTRINSLSSDLFVSEGSSHLIDVEPRTGPALNLFGSVPRTFPRVRTSPPGRVAQGDDGSTLLGRRVAARIAMAPSVADTTSATNQLMGDIGQIYEGSFNSIASVTSSYEEELERVLRAMDARRRTSPAVPLRTIPPGTSTFARTSSQGLPQLSPQQSSQGTPQSSSQTPPGSSLNPQRDLGAGSVPNSTRQNSGSSERLSLLSNLSVQNFPIPSTSNVQSRPLIFDGHSSYVSPETVDPSRESRYPPAPESTLQGRNYVVRRSYDRNGEELVHNITVDWDDGDPISWLMPSPNVSRRHRNRFSSPRQNLDILRTTDPIAPLPLAPPPPPQGTANASTNQNDPPRRRGWGEFVFLSVHLLQDITDCSISTS